MIRRLFIPLLASGLLLAATAGSASAKCEEGADPMPEFCSEVIVSFLNNSQSDLQAGVAHAVSINVSQGEQPFEAIGVVLSFENQQDGSLIQVPATASAQPGLWRAEVTLPSKGIWIANAQVVTNTGANYRIFMERVRVVLPPAPPPVETPATPPVTPTTPALPIALVLAGIAAAAIGGQLIGNRSRRRTAGAGAPAGASAASADRA